METITREKIAEMLKSKLGLSASICLELTNYVFAAIEDITMKGDTLKIKNFGNFLINSKGARPGVNLKTGEAVTIAPRKVLRFLPAKKLKSCINNVALK